MQTCGWCNSHIVEAENPCGVGQRRRDAYGSCTIPKHQQARAQAYERLINNAIPTISEATVQKASEEYMDEKSQRETKLLLAEICEDVDLKQDLPPIIFIIRTRL